MAKQLTELKVFISSPEDVKSERLLIEDVVRELNLTFKEIRLELVKWETHAAPSLGIDAQAVINGQIPNDYDIFVGILWSRFGTPTPRAGSGTEEEFNCAYGRVKANSDSIRVMFYFKNAAIKPNEIDLEQLAKIAEFKKSISTKGLFWQYETDDEFTKYLRLHLSKAMQEWGKSWGDRCMSPASAIASAGSSPVDHENSTVEDEAGLLDIAESSEKAFQESTECLDRITVLISELGSKISSHAIKLSTHSSSCGNATQAKKLVNAAAHDMDEFSARMEVEVPILRQRLSDGFDALISYLTLLRDFPQESAEVNRVLNGVNGFDEALRVSRKTIQGFRKSVDDLPRLTTMLNRARKRVTTVLDQFLDHFGESFRLNAEVGTLLRDLGEPGVTS